jgi:hypothetical protein
MMRRRRRRRRRRRTTTTTTMGGRNHCFRHHSSSIALTDCGRRFKSAAVSADCKCSRHVFQVELPARAQLRFRAQLFHMQWSRRKSRVFVPLH